MRISPRKIAATAGAFLAAGYLTFLVDAFTLNTVLKRVFVFCYFVVMGHIALFLKRRYLGSSGDGWRALTMSVAGGLALLIMLHGVLFANIQETVISLSAVPSEDGALREVWLVAAGADGEGVYLSQLEVDANQGWVYLGENDDYVFYPGEEGQENYLTFRTTADEVKLYFSQNAWSGSVNILVDESEDTAITLTAAEGVNETIEHTIKANRAYVGWEYLLYGMGAWVLLSFLAAVVLGLLEKFFRKGGSTQTEKQAAVTALLLLNAGFLFFTSDKIHPTGLTRCFLMLLTLAASLCFVGRAGEAAMKKYRSRSGWTAILGVSAYASLASFAQRFFLDGNTRIHSSFAGGAYCLSGVLWFVPVVWLLLCAVESLSKPHKVPQLVKKRWQAHLILLAVLFLCQLLVLSIVWPGGFASDAINQLNQAMGFFPLHDWHPVLHTLLESVILSLTGRAAAITVVQMLLFSWLLGEFLMIAYDRGVSLKILCLLGCVFQLLPNQVLSWSNVLKDFPFTLALMWGTYLLLHLVLRSPWSGKWSFVFCLGLDMFLIAGLRHNGIIPVVAMALLCVVLTLRRFPEMRMRLVAAVTLSVVLFGFYKGPVFSLLNVEGSAQSPYTTMLCAVASCINKDLPLSPESEAIMDTVLPLEDWKDYYDRYQGHDRYMWGRPEGSRSYNADKINLRDMFHVYLGAFTKYPDVIIKDRLDGMDIMWDVAQPIDSFNARSFYGVYSFPNNELIFDMAFLTQEDECGLYNNNELFRLYRNTLDFSLNSAGDILLWRTGAYLIGFLVLLVFWWKNHMGRLFWASIPMLGNIAGSMLVLYHQSFRYVYFIQVGVVALIFVTVILGKELTPQNALKEQKEK